ncbi:homoserine dehydrogenase [Panacagrimonas perspica]|uniref:Homoserine dehydrogenase n=1 Tax=Panacagrimonas perspica TaxID=381431 RepID=A0A4R7PBQ0_9GAMM|nr:homoserine dehydrogenase [Panacagrimonas perspica]TDU31112.1 homoserine dehydrogenase [Panacagrimonas perspica]THD01976.1 homoserine dehydrogenase [Panacagrimonas perspica]
MSTPLKIGLMGLGTVGQGVLRVLRKNADEIERRIGRKLVVTHIATKDLDRNSESLEGITVSDDALTCVRSADVDVVVEVMGGYNIAKQVTLAAIERGKPVVTANKALLAEHGNEIFAAAAKAGVGLGFEAAVAGGIPIIKAVREGLAGNRIDSLAGIINGTCNYILTQMTVKGQTFADALSDAQKLGYAEADPTFDVEGVDAAHKLTILASIAFGIPLSFGAVAREGISKITAQDIQIALTLGYRIKLLGIAQRSDAGVSLRVHPTLVPDDQLIAKVDGVVNAVVVNGNAVGQVGFYGRGAGGDPTASAIVADLIDVARSLGVPQAQRVPVLAFQPGAMKALPLLAIADIESCYYLRLRVADEPGVLKAITGTLAESDISIEAILQKEPREHEDATVALITSAVKESKFDAAMQRLLALPFVREGASRIRVEHFKS